MIVPGSVNPLLLATGGYEIPYSLRFRAANSAYLSRSFGTPTSNIKWTWSGWIKRGALGTQLVFNGGDGSSNNFFSVQFTAGDLIQIAQISGGAYNLQMTTSAVFRDPSAWYHIVIVYDSANATSTDRVQIYINNSRQTVSYTTGPFGASTACQWNVNARTHYLRRLDYSAIYGDMYAAEENFIDGQALTPSSFGQTDSATGVWVPKKYSGTYGTNGFYLKFADASAATAAAIGKDSSGNANNFTPSGISVTSGVTYDQMTDTPTLNYAVWNPLDTRGGAVPTNANMNPGVGNSQGVRGTFGVTSGKWYWEHTLVTASTDYVVGIGNQNPFGIYVGSNTDSVGYFSASGEVRRNASVIFTYGTWNTSGKVVGFALDQDAGTLQIYVDGVSQGSAFSHSLTGTIFPMINFGTGYGTPVAAINFGQRPFAYTPPSGFKALNTANLPTPSIKKGSLYMDATLRTGTGATASVSSLGFQPDLVWIKSRSAATDHGLYDAVRGVQKQLESNTTTGETTETTGLTAFNSNGYTVGALAQLNTSAATYVDWAWKEGVTPGFDIVTYTGNGTNRTISHALGAVPKFMVVKRLDTGNGWVSYHASQNASPATGYMYLNSTAGFAAASTMWNNTAPTSSVFSVGTNSETNGNTFSFVGYLWSEIEGFSKFGSYTGNASADGPFVWCGFRPRWIMIKDATAANLGWRIYDTVRETYNVMGGGLEAADAAAENYATSVRGIDVLSNGFKIRVSASGINGSGAVFVFAAFAENPFKYARAR